jgi:L-alanine-DL-glutamate epimerase-like enolase superfamily enzyme
MMMPKWFDKSPELTPDDNVAQLRRALGLAIDALLAAGSGTPFGLVAGVEAGHHAACAAEGLPPLVASYGLALVERAMLDALGRAENRPVAELVRSNRIGLTAATAPDLGGFDLDGFLAGLRPAESIAVRHTVGLADPLTEADLPASDRLNDGLPETLEEAIAAYGHRFFKLKIAGDPEADVDRLGRIAAVLDRLSDYRVTLDGNEQYPDPATVAAFLDRLAAAPGLDPLRAAILFLEQPMARAVTLSTRLDVPIAVEIDEADGAIDAFPEARGLGYTGISAKSCKGFTRALLNRARVAAWGEDRFFMSAEDLTTQAGIAVQQDLLLASVVGATHVERNGHHYVDGMAGAPAAEQARFLAAHGDLYVESQGRARLAIKGGAVSLASLAAAPGLGSAVEPDWAAMTRMQMETPA